MTVSTSINVESRFRSKRTLAASGTRSSLPTTSHNFIAYAIAAAKELAAPVEFVSGPVTPPDVMSASLRGVKEQYVRFHEDERCAFYVADLACIADRFRDFRVAFPRVTPYYAVKCNPDPVVVQFLAHLGASFDCASAFEIDLVAEAISRSGRPSSDLNTCVVFANPFKADAHLAHAQGLGVDLMTFDGVDELFKIARMYPCARLLLRIAVEDSHAQCPLSSKFGAHLDEVPEILAVIRQLGLKFVGVAFHVGSGATEVGSYLDALHTTRDIFDKVDLAGMPPLTTLDIGGGFPGFDGEAPVTFAEIADAVSPAIDELFDPYVRVIAEPGRYLVAAAYSLATQVVSCRTLAHRRDYYIGDGVYGSFRDALLLGINFVAYPLSLSNSTNADIEESEEFIDTPCSVGHLYGPTQDALDVVSRDALLPKLNDGDWLYFSNMGAYTMSLATILSGVPRPRVWYYFSLDTLASSPNALNLL